MNFVIIVIDQFNPDFILLVAILFFKEREYTTHRNNTHGRSPTVTLIISQEKYTYW